MGFDRGAVYSRVGQAETDDSSCGADEGKHGSTSGRIAIQQVGLTGDTCGDCKGTLALVESGVARLLTKSKVGTAVRKDDDKPMELFRVGVPCAEEDGREDAQRDGECERDQSGFRCVDKISANLTACDRRNSRSCTPSFLLAIQVINLSEKIPRAGKAMNATTI